MADFAAPSGIEIISSAMVPEFSLEALPDAEDRLAAMTAHHLDLSLLDLNSLEPVVWMFDGKLLCHPANVARFRKELETISATPR